MNIGTIYDIIVLIYIVPELGGVLFTLSRPKGLRVGPIVEKCAEFRNPFFLKKSRRNVSQKLRSNRGTPFSK